MDAISADINCFAKVRVLCFSNISWSSVSNSVKKGRPSVSVSKAEN